MTAAGLPSPPDQPTPSPGAPLTPLLPPPPRTGGVTLTTISYQLAYLIQEQALTRANLIQGHQLVAAALDRFADQLAVSLAPALARELVVLLGPPPPETPSD